MPEQSPRRQVIAARLAILAVAFVAGANLLRPSRASVAAEAQQLRASEVQVQLVPAQPTPAPGWRAVAVPRSPARAIDRCRCLTVRRSAAGRLPAELRMRIAQQLANGAVTVDGG